MVKAIDTRMIQMAILGWLIGVGLSNAISIPYLSVYEASNAFGYFHANTIYKEYPILAQYNFKVVENKPKKMPCNNSK